jgi:hypothetical protein
LEATRFLARHQQHQPAFDYQTSCLFRLTSQAASCTSARCHPENGRAAGPACRASTPIFERITSAGPIRIFPLPNMKTPRHFEKISTSAGLLVLGAGFVSLGALSFIKRHLEDAESGLLLNSAYPIIGGLISILLGFAFFAIALLFMATRRKEEKAPRKVGRARDPQPIPNGESFIDSPARPHQDDWFGPEVAFCKHEAPRERLVLVGRSSA